MLKILQESDVAIQACGIISHLLPLTIMDESIHQKRPNATEVPEMPGHKGHLTDVSDKIG